MTKPRAMLAVLLTAAGGWFLAADGRRDFVSLVYLLVGVALSGGGSIVFNQWIERDHDRRMERTSQRALPSGIVTPTEAVIWATFLSLAGIVLLFVQVNSLTGWLALVSVVSYSFIYTPLKRVTTLNTAIGAVPGAIPPMMGWTAVTGDVSVEAWLLFIILFLWQFPHFLAIAWLYRKDYGRAGYAMLPVIDPAGDMTSRQMVLNALCLFVATLAPYTLRFAGVRYLFGAAIIGAALLVTTIVFARTRSTRAAYWVLKGSVVHIAILMGLFVWDRWT